MRLADERRHERDRQQHDQPRRVHDQPCGETGDGDDVLRLCEELAHQRHAPGGLPARALQAILEFAVLEILQVERRRVLHEAQARGVGELLGEQRIEVRYRPSQHVRQHREREFEKDQPTDAIQEPQRVPLAPVVRRVRGLREQNDLVDDQLADVQRDDRKQRTHQAQSALHEREARIGLPDELEERRKVAQCADPLAQRPRRRAERRIGGSGGRRTAARRILLGHDAIVRVASRPPPRLHVQLSP